LIYSVSHRSSYAYEEMVDLSYHVLHLTPRALAHQRVVEIKISTTPAAQGFSEDVDYFGNPIGFMSLVAPHDHLVVEMTARVEVTRREPVDPRATAPWETVRDALDRPICAETVAAAEFVGPSPLVPLSEAFVAYAEPSFPPGRPLLDAVLDLTHRIHREFVFDPSATELTTPLTEVLERQRGVCQDFAHAEIAALRSVGLAARYVSGYVRTFGARGGPRLVGADASHAWVSVFCPGIGWVDVDPTNDRIVDDEHIVLAWGRDYGDVSPVRGVILGTGEHSLTVAVDVAPVG
jgi:transglutaminase-like putative cysteine protease